MAPAPESVTFGDLSVTTVVNSPPWYENCYLVRHIPTGSQLVIDPGGEPEKILAAIKAGGGPVVAILLTHGHPDHLGAVHDLQQALNAPCQAHQREEPIVRAASNWAGALMGMRLKGPQNCDYFDGEPVLELAPFRCTTHHTPGHTPGGVCYVFDDFVFTGDTLFNQGVGRTDLPGGDGSALSSSITRLLGSLSERQTLFSGHGPSWTVAEARPWWRQASWMFQGED